MALGTALTVRFEEEEWEALKAKAETERRSIGFLVREAVSLFLGTEGSNAADDGSVTGQTQVPSSSSSDAGVSTHQVSASAE